MSSRYADYEYLAFDRPHERVLRITMTRDKAWNAVNEKMHSELARIWTEVDADPEVNAAILTGSGQGFSVGGDSTIVKAMSDDPNTRARVWRETRDIAWGLINCSKPVVSAIRGPAFGGALAAALFCDISVVTPKAKLLDGHILLGVAAGDGGALIWPLHCGMAKAKYHIMMCEQISGAEAERIGLVSLLVEDEELEARTVAIATKLAEGPPLALRWTKYALNGWYRANGSIFDTAAGLEFMAFPSPEAAEGLASLEERRPGRFAPTAPL